MTNKAWIISSILSALLVAGLGVFTYWQQGNELEKAQAAQVEARKTLDQQQTQIAALKTELGQHREQIDSLRQEKEAATQAQKSLESQMRSALDSKDITISELQGKLTVNILDRILFDLGEATLKPEGEKVLQKIATVLAPYPNRKIHVIGHTDNIPIKPAAWSRYPSNWELSTARATAAVRYLCEKGGMDPRRLGAVGYGEFRPVADNATAEGRAKNRRIALVVLSDELVGADITSGITNALANILTNAATASLTPATNTAPAANPAPSTNSAPAATTNAAPATNAVPPPATPPGN